MLKSRRDKKKQTSKPQASKTMALIQLEAVHEEIVPSMCQAFAANDVNISCFLNERIEQNRQDLFSHLPSFPSEYNYVPVTTADDWTSLAKRLREDDKVSSVFFNTFQRDGIADFALTIGKPIAGMVHNPVLFLNSEKCMEAAGHRDVELFTLAKHATSYLQQKDPVLFKNVRTLHPFYWGFPVDKFKSNATQKTHIAIAGSVNFGNRDLPGLVKAIAQRKDGLNLKFLITGGGPDRKKLQSLIKDDSLEDYFEFADLDADTGFVSHENYFKCLSKADLILPLLPDNKADYREYKISASISTSVGFILPAIVDQWTAGVYDIPSVTYPFGELSKGLDKANAMSRKDVLKLKAQLDVYRTQKIRQNANAVADYLNDI